MPSFVPHAYQQRAIDDVIRDPYHALFMDPGLGKTSITLAAFMQLREELDVCKALVIAPLRVCESVWPEEIAKWNEFRGLRAVYLGDPDALEVDADIYLINPERVGQLFGTRVVVESKAKKKRTVWRPGPWRDWVGRPEMLVIDESSRFKRSSGIRTRSINRYLKDFGRRLALTGTPAANGLHDLHGQMLLVDGGASLDPRVTYFEKRYFDSERVGNRRVFTKFTLKHGADELIYAAIADRVTSLRAADYLELPELVMTDVPVLIPDQIIAAIKELEEECALELGELEWLDDGGALTKKKQLINGVAYPGTPFETRARRWYVVHEQKLLACEDLLDEIGRPAIVAYEFRSEREELAKRLRARGKRVGRVGGGLKANEPKEAIRAWNAGELDVLLAHPEAAGLGLNLQTGSDTVIWFAPPWNLEHYQQLNGRLHRQGQRSDRVFVYHLTGVGTLDRRVARVLRKKDATQEALLNALKE